MKKDFITGLIILLPLALTIAIVVFIFNLLTGPFSGIVNEVFEHYNIFENGFLFLSAHQIQNLVAKLLVLVSLFLVTIGLGFIGRWFFVHSFIKLAEYIVKRIPVVSLIYKTCKEVIKTIFTSNTNSFKQVVLVPFPNSQSQSIGLVTREFVAGLQGISYEDMAVVFVPTTPNPTSGFLIMYKQRDLIYLDMKVEDAFKYIISCGVIAPHFAVKSQEMMPEKPQSEDQV